MNARSLLFAVTKVVACFATACTSSPANDITNATIANVHFSVVDGAAMIRNVPASMRGLTNIVLTDFANACSVADERTHPNSKQLTFLLSDFTSGQIESAPPSHPGSYPISVVLPTSGPYAVCGFSVLDGTCLETTMASCDSGMVTLTRVDAQGYAGTFDVVIQGQHVTGEFDVPNCSGVSESGFGTCQ